MDWYRTQQKIRFHLHEFKKQLADLLLALSKIRSWYMYVDTIFDWVTDDEVRLQDFSRDATLNPPHGEWTAQWRTMLIYRTLLTIGPHLASIPLTVIEQLHHKQKKVIVAKIGDPCLGKCPLTYISSLGDIRSSRTPSAIFGQLNIYFSPKINVT